jgi:hypothetical protein
MTEEEESWEADSSLLIKRKTSPFEPTPSEEEKGITAWKKIKEAAKAKTRHH